MWNLRTYCSKPSHPQPGFPNASQPFIPVRDGYTTIPRLIVDDPPRVRPLFPRMRRPLSCSFIHISSDRVWPVQVSSHTCGVDRKFQSKSGSSNVVGASPGIVIRGSFNRLVPASRTSTRTLGSSVSRLATTKPDVPPPTITKSKLESCTPTTESVSISAIPGYGCLGVYGFRMSGGQAYLIKTPKRSIDPSENEDNPHY